MGQDRANPAAMILSATMTLRHLGLDVIANKIASFQLVGSKRLNGRWVLQTPNSSYPQLGSSTTPELMAAVIKNLEYIVWHLCDETRARFQDSHSPKLLSSFLRDTLM